MTSHQRRRGPSESLAAVAKEAVQAETRTPSVRLTEPTKKLLRALIKAQVFDPGNEMFGLDLTRITGIAPGTAYPILRRLHQARWLEARKEAPGESDQGRPPRIYYRIVPGSLQAIQLKVAEHDAKHHAAATSSAAALKPRGAHR